MKLRIRGESLRVSTLFINVVVTKYYLKLIYLRENSLFNLFYFKNFLLLNLFRKLFFLLRFYLFVLLFNLLYEFFYFKVVN